MHSSVFNDLIEVWKSCLFSIDDWKKRVENITPIDTGCGIVYELPNPIDRPNEDLAIVDMRHIKVTQPHYDMQTEVYFVLQGEGIVVVGNDEYLVTKGSVVVISPKIAHYTIPRQNLVLAVVATPPYNRATSVSLFATDQEHRFDQNQFEKFTKI